VTKAIAPDQRSGGTASDVVTPLALDELPDGGAPAGAVDSTAPFAGRELGLLADVEVSLSVEVGSVSLPLRRLLELNLGTVLELGRPADAPVDILVNGRLLARGDVVMVDGEMSVRIAELVTDPGR
jgi:flagellar motor switch protein FliN/FliY